MNRFALIAICMLLVGCNNASRFLGGAHSTQTDGPKELVTVACCQDNDGANNFSYPSFLPAAHVALCQKASLAAHSDTLIDGKVYLPMHVSCGHKLYTLGDQDYPSTGY